MRERRRSRKKQNINWLNMGIGAIALGILLVLFLLVIAGYSTARPEEAENLYEKLLGEADGALLSGAAERTEEAARACKEEMNKPVEAARTWEEKLPEVRPDLRLENTVDFAALKERNPDVYAWITVPGTLVDYPVLQHPTDDEYYLHHTIDYVEGLPGSIYSEAVHPKDFSAANTILYGHNMKNDTMFGSLHDYENVAFFEEHPYVYIHLPDRTLLYQIFAAVKFQSVYLPNYLNFEEEEGFTAYVEELKESPGFVNMGVETPFGSRLLTLHTCIGNDKNHRYLVVAVLAGQYERE